MIAPKWIRYTTLCSFAFGGLLASSAAYAQDERQQNRQDRQQKQQQRQQRNDSQNAQSREVELPQALQELDLKENQKQSIKQSIRQHNQELQQAWQQFHQKHMAAVELEAAWVAAVRDSLSEEDQKRFDQRHQESKQGQNRQQKGQRERSNNDSASSNERDRDETQRADRSEQRRERQEARRDRQDQQQQRAPQQDGERSARGGNDNSAQQDAQDKSLVIIAVTNPREYAHGSQQNEQQKQQCEQACQEYKQKLSSVWSDLHRLHARMVQIEAEKMNAIEDELTQEQLTQLRETRQSPSTASRNNSESRVR